MGIDITAGTVGSMAWKGMNTLLGAAGTAMGATSLGSKTSENKVREIIHEELGCGNGYRNGCGWNRGGFNESIFIDNSGANTTVNRYELGQTQEIARLQAKEYSDMSDLKLFEDYTTRLANEKERVNDKLEIIFKEQVSAREKMQAEICRIDKEVALNKQAMDYQFFIANGNFNTVNTRLNAITKEVIPLSAICPQPLSGCVPVGFQGQIVTTVPTGETNTVLSNIKTASK